MCRGCVRIDANWLREAWVSKRPFVEFIGLLCEDSQVLIPDTLIDRLHRNASVLRLLKKRVGSTVIRINMLEKLDAWRRLYEAYSHVRFEESQNQGAGPGVRDSSQDIQTSEY